MNSGQIYKTKNFFIWIWLNIKMKVWLNTRYSMKWKKGKCSNSGHDTWHLVLGPGWSCVTQCAVDTFLATSQCLHGYHTLSFLYLDWQNTSHKIKIKISSVVLVHIFRVIFLCECIFVAIQYSYSNIYLVIHHFYSVALFPIGLFFVG